MREKLTILFLLLFLFGLLTFTGCRNSAAERLADDCWKYKQQLLLENANFNANEQELFLIEVMQAKGFGEDEIICEIEKIREAKK